MEIKREEEKVETVKGLQERVQKNLKVKVLESQKTHLMKYKISKLKNNEIIFDFDYLTKLELNQFNSTKIN